MAQGFNGIRYMGSKLIAPIKFLYCVQKYMDGLEDDAGRIQVLEYFSTLMKYVPEISSNIVQLIKVDINYYIIFDQFHSS